MTGVEPLFKRAEIGSDGKVKADAVGRVLVKVILQDPRKAPWQPVQGNRREEIALDGATVGEVYRTIDRALFHEQADPVEALGLAGPSYPPFVTGSRAYGLPDDDADLDVVMLLPPLLMNLLEAAADKPPMDLNMDYREFRSWPFWFGRMNVIACLDPVVWRMWWDGTEHLKKMRPVTREFAVKYFAGLRAERLGRAL